MKKIFSFILVVAIIMTSSINIWATEKYNIDAIETEIEERLSQQRSNEQYDDYYIGDVFVVTSKHASGRSEYAYNLGDEVHYKLLDEYGNIIEEDEINVSSTVHRASKEQLQELDEILLDSTLGATEKAIRLDEIGYIEKQHNGVSYYVMSNSLENPLSTSKIEQRSNNVAYVNDLTLLIDTYPYQYDVLAGSSYYYCQALGSNKNVTVRDDRYNYVETGSDITNFAAGYNIVKAAAAICVPITSLKIALETAGAIIDVINGIQTLRETRNVSHPISARATRYRYGQIYDYTKENAWVTCASQWGYDYFVLTRVSPNVGEWRYHGSTNFGDEYAVEECVADAGYAYNLAIEQYGLWPWG